MASYKYLLSDVSCGTWKFTNNKEGFVDIEATAQHSYNTRVISSTNAPNPDKPGFFIPKLVNVKGDWENVNETSIYFGTQYYDGTNIVIDNID